MMTRLRLQIRKSGCFAELLSGIGWPARSIGVMNVNKRRNVRIISGSGRGSKIHFPEIPGLRPTGDRIRETLFAWLQASITGSRCLDLFAGSGALGFEAASRGAARVVMIEKNRVASQSLQSNAQRLKFADVEIIAADALSPSLYKSRLAGQQYDLVFIDPPFAENLHMQAIDCLIQNELLLPDAWIYIESSKRSDSMQVPAEWQLHREKTAGEVHMQLYRVIADN